MATKLSQLTRMMAAGDYRAALKMAAGWGKRGLGNADHAEAITKAWSAATNPEFYRSIEQDPDALIRAGVAAIRDRYKLSGEVVV